MLQNIRDRLTGPFVWFIVGLIVIPFAFFGIETFRTGGGDPTVAKVGDQKITQSQLRLGFEQRLRQLQALLGDNFRADQFDNNRFREAVLQDMIEETRLRQFAREAGYRASDAALFGSIQSIPAFQENGKFSSELYRSRLANQGYTPERFEMQLRDSIVIDQLREGVVATSFATEPMVAEAYRLENQERWLAYATFEARRYLDRVAVTDEQVAARYEEQKSRFMAPERMRLAYVELALDALPPAEAPAPDVLKVIYEAEKATRFSTPEERLTRHLLINFGADKEASRKRAETIAQKIRNGSDFSALAQAESDDAGSKKNGGSLGWVKRGQMLEKFEQALFSLGKGQLSEPVETEYGWHLIRVDDVRDARIRAFEEPDVQAELLATYRVREAQRRFQEMSERLEQLAFESPNSLDAAAKELRLEVRTTDWFTRAGGAGLLANRAVLDAAFSDEVARNGENSRPIPAGDNRVVVVRKQEYEAPRQKALAEVEGEIRAELRQQAAREKAQADADAVLDALRQGRSLEQAAREKGAAVSAPGLVKRDKADVDAKLREALYRLPRPAAGKASFGQARQASGDVAVLVMTAVNDPAWPGSGAEADRERARLRDALAGAEFSAYREAIEAEVPSKVVAPPAAEAPEPVS